MIGIYATAKQLREELINAGFNQVTFGDGESMLDGTGGKKTLYPAAHLTPTGMSISSSVANVTYDVVAVDIIDDTKDNVALDSFGELNNVEDILHDLANKINMVFQRIKRNTDVFETTDDALSLNPILGDFGSRCAGYQFTINYQVLNADESSC